jgi:hypothetical protein
MQQPKIIEGNFFTDTRGTIVFNNSFDASEIKRIYIINNSSVDFKRGWQGHQIEQRWFSALNGSFCIKLIKIDNWEFPSRNLECLEFFISNKSLDVLHVPEGYISCIKAIEKDSKLLVMANYSLGELVDEYRFKLNYFKNGF